MQNIMMISNLCKSEKNLKRFKNAILDIRVFSSKLLKVPSTGVFTENNTLLGFKKPPKKSAKPKT